MAAIAELRLLQGRLDEADRLVAGLEDHAQAAAVTARLHLAHGRPAAAGAVVRRQLAAIGPDRLDSSSLVELLAESLLAQGDIDGATAQAQRLIDLSSGGSDVIRARGERLLGRAVAATDLDLARAHLDAALVAFVRLEMRYDAAQTRMILAQTLRDSVPEVSIAEARAALAAFEDLGAGRGADSAAALLRALGVRVGRVGTRGSSALTKREQEIFLLLGEGMSNPDIAARLVLSRKTVEHHVASILAKLGLSSRSAAAAEAVRGAMTDRAQN